MLYNGEKNATTTNIHIASRIEHQQTMQTDIEVEKKRIHRLWIL